MSIRNQIETRLLDRYQSVFADERLNIGILFILPLFALILFLIAYPLINTIWISFHSVQGTITNWIGLENYISYVTSGSFYQVIRNTVIWTVLGVILQVLVGLSAALLINTKFYGRKIIRSLLLLPWIVPGVVVAIIWKWMYDPEFGIFNYVLAGLGVIDEPIAWLAQPDLALFALIIAAVWKQFPFVMIMLFAGLQDVDQQLHKAAITDGVPFYARLRHVTLPQLMPVLIVVTLLTTIWTFNNFVIIYVATGGGPAGATTTLPVEIYTIGFEQFRFGMSATVSVITLLFGAVIIAIYLRTVNRMEVEV